MFSKIALAATLLTAVQVSAHQNFEQFWVNDQTPGDRVAIRMPPNNSPVTNLTSNDITCNMGGNKVPSGVTTFPAAEGDSITVKWTQSTHPGPITHFLFGPVDDASMATGVGEWFKIDEFDTADGKWASEVMDAGNMTYTFKLPKGLKTGDYLMRSEMLALHGSQSLGGGQFYIGCAQLKITGTGSSNCSPVITLPGAYKDTDTDIYIPKFYNGFDKSNYTAPGGPVAVCDGSAAAGNSSAAATTASVAAAAPTSPGDAGNATTPTSAVSATATALASTAALAVPNSMTTSAVLTASCYSPPASSSIAKSSIVVAGNAIANASVAASSIAATSTAAASTVDSPSTFATSVVKTASCYSPPASVSASASSTISMAAGITYSAAVSTGTGTSSSSSNVGGSVKLYDQCGGANWTGATTCASGTCVVQNEFYSQCA